MFRGDFDYLKVAAAASVHVAPSASPRRQHSRARNLYGFMTTDLLDFARQPLSDDVRKSILNGVLTGLVELHDRRIIHTGQQPNSVADIKPRNILINHDEMVAAGQELTVRQVRISDFEDAVQLDPGKSLRGCLCGNEFWRSPESWARVKQSLTSDVYSFGIVAIYVMLKHMVFRVPDEQLDGDNDWRHILWRHISYFADEEGLEGLVRHIGREDPYIERLVALAGDFGPVKPRESFALWHYADAEFPDVVDKMTNLDPARRITAREALEHPWFQAAELV
ncbi:calcium/calmodulin dependent protein kinase [Staphylotrichum tortipilum]|uniref:Calcium/calmodulin dependent protein kinase n=1 Tax=Staphylotrichum tortipilum TaxID=2831512 RepID=A0AAN6RTB7_9PEZI|nr:calcium/calmodulin dependent protein kinase [Staphylotrichum longicolle]